MKKLLPIFFLLLTAYYLLLPSSVQAQTNCAPPRTATPAIIINSTDPQALAILDGSGTWQPDEDVTFAGKLAARSENTLNWLLCNYEWQKLQQLPSTDNPLQKLWLYVSYVSYALIGLFILAAAFLMIITRGRSITVRRFIPRFVLILALILFSFAIVTNLYTLTDYLQGFFITINGQRINTYDLLSVAFKYEEFVGLRKVDQAHTLAESAVITLLLVKLTAATYYTIFVELIIRKIILWFFLLVSPIFPLLLFFKPLRNTAKIWVGELFRWMLYAPLFAIFLRGLVEIWRSTNGIPLKFDYAPALDPASNAEIIYPTSVNILLGGPYQQLTVAGNQSVNYVDTFVLYVVALIMLWMVIIVPWILLRIFLDYFYNYNMSESGLAKYLASPNSPLSPLFHRNGPSIGPSPQGTPPLPPSPAGAGLARSLPMTKFRHSPVTEIQQSLQEAQAQQREANVTSMNQVAQNVTSQTAQNVASQTAQNVASQTASNLAQNYGSLVSSSNNSSLVSDLQTQQMSAEVLNLANLSIPTMKDIAKYEAAMMSQSAPGREEVSRMSEMLSRISGTSSITSPAEKERFSHIRERIIQAANKGNPVAKSVASAAQPAVAKGIMPEVNRVQQVNLDDYEEIKKTWIDNYRRLEPPVGKNGEQITRKAWLKEEVSKIPTVIDLLMSGDPANVEKGMQMVSNILPFLLLGGFSKTEIIAYLKAKLEAAKQVFNEVMQVEKDTEEEESKVEVTDKEPAQKSMEAQAEIPEESSQTPASNNDPVKTDSS